MFTFPARLAGLVLVVWSFAVGAANWGQFDFDFDSEKTWTELQTQLPKYPRDEDLVEFSVSPTNANKFFIDEKSISVGPDGVVRYTLVVKAPGGAVNISFEGIRCEKRTVRTYALGKTNGTWSKARDAQWRDIVFKDYNRQHHVLYDDFFCPRNIMISQPQEAITALKYHGMHPRAATDPSASF